MRIRMTRHPHGEIDGVPLDRFEPGEVYDMSVSIPTYLMVCGCAQAIADSGLAAANEWQRVSHANGARRRSGARESVSGSPRGEALG